MGTIALKESLQPSMAAWIEDSILTTNRTINTVITKQKI
ncbi:hypothetical protein QOZ91_002458 [Clostridium sardiniense]|nr:hypothetical protein [Clostridium sardiniense]